MIILEELHQELNPLLFMDDKLKPEIRERLLEIVDEFSKSLKIDDVSWQMLDILLVGSQAGYNYTQYSDIDVHIVVNLSQICRECPEIVQYLFNAEKSRFNKNYDITVKGLEVEIYVEDVRASTRSNGIYSILNDKWVKVPTEERMLSTDDIEWSSNNKYQEIVTDINSSINSGMADDIQNTINELYLMRKQGLEADGESSEDNLIFKQLRNEGYLDKLKGAYYEIRSKELTLEGIKS